MEVTIKTSQRFYQVHPMDINDYHFETLDLMLSSLGFLEIAALSPVKSTCLYHLSVLLPHTQMQLDLIEPKYDSRLALILSTFDIWHSVVSLI